MFSYSDKDLEIIDFDKHYVYDYISDRVLFDKICFNRDNALIHYVDKHTDEFNYIIPEYIEKMSIEDKLTYDFDKDFYFVYDGEYYTVSLGTIEVPDISLEFIIKILELRYDEKILIRN